MVDRECHICSEGGSLYNYQRSYYCDGCMREEIRRSLRESSQEMDTNRIVNRNYKKVYHQPRVQ